MIHVTTKDVTFEDEMYYSLNDIAKLTNLPKDLIQQELKKRNVKYNLMLGKIRVYEGKRVEPIIQSIIEQGSKQTVEKRRQYPLLEGNLDYNSHQIIKKLNISESMFNTIYLGVNRLKYIKFIEGRPYYKGCAVNRITHQINEGTPPIKPIRVDAQTYTKAEILRKLNISIDGFNKTYIKTFQLQPTSIDTHHAYQGYIRYDGNEVNNITETILHYYGRVLP